MNKIGNAVKTLRASLIFFYFGLVGDSWIELIEIFTSHCYAAAQTTRNLSVSKFAIQFSAILLLNDLEFARVNCDAVAIIWRSFMAVFLWTDVDCIYSYIPRGFRQRFSEAFFYHYIINTWGFNDFRFQNVKRKLIQIQF